MTVEYRQGEALVADEFIAVLKASGLAERRPVEDRDRIDAMLRHANVIVTARAGGQLVGVARGMSDFGFSFYLSDLAVAADHQGQGVGRALIRRAHEWAGRHTMLILLAAPAAASYYPHIGLASHPGCWTIPRRS